MPCYHSKYNEELVGGQEVCSCAVCPIKTEFRGPATKASPDQDDVIDETLNYFRANVLFKNFDIRGSADRTLIYLTIFTQQCLVKCEKIEDKAAVSRELNALAIKPMILPGDSAWPLGAIYPKPSSNEETELFKAYFKQARSELAVRLVDRLFDKDGVKSKWWQAFSKRKFMGKELKE